MEFRHSIEAADRRASVRAVPTTPRLSRRAGLWAVAFSFSFLVMAAFSTAPSSLYDLFAHRYHRSSLTITFVYAVYAVDVVVSLVLVGHVSDWYGRRVVLLPTVAVAAVLFLLWRSLVGLCAARVLTGVALGAAVATATAYTADLDAGSAAPQPAGPESWPRSPTSAAWRAGRAARRLARHRRRRRHPDDDDRRSPPVPTVS
jgi:MFS family permease